MDEGHTYYLGNNSANFKDSGSCPASRHCAINQILSVSEKSLLPQHNGTYLVLCVIREVMLGSSQISFIDCELFSL